MAGIYDDLLKSLLGLSKNSKSSTNNSKDTKVTPTPKQTPPKKEEPPVKQPSAQVKTEEPQNQRQTSEYLSNDLPYQRRSMNISVTHSDDHEDIPDITFDTSVADDDVDNSDLSYTGKNICIKLNNNENARNNRVKRSEQVLCDRFPKLKEIPSGTRMQTILEGLFPEGFSKQMYIRNLSFTAQSGSDVKVLGIRPERTPGDYLEDYIPNNISLLFKGYIAGKVFIVNSVHEVANTDKLDFEVDVVATPYENQEMIRSNFLYDILDKAGSLTEYTGEKLKEWKEYLQWKMELARRQIYGCKYYKVAFDDVKKRLIFWLVFEDKEAFSAFRKYLGRDIQVFDNDYSKDKWHFDFAGDTNNKYQRFNSIELGRYRGVVSEYYLKEDPEFSDNNEESIDDETLYSEDSYNETDYYFDEDDDTEDVASEQDIYDVFDNPYIVQVAYELNRKDTDEINRRNLDDEGISQYVHEYVLGNYYSNGFLALSAIGEFVLINRFQQAIRQLEMDECYSPNIAMWLFNVARARTPNEGENISVERWLNPHIEKNENQKNAVYKMLAAPDLCLVQGPPGTGKTTVIAEAIYQFVRKGYRVLVASQSNDAVDNALERLADTPEIRAIRLGQKGKRKRKVDDLSTRKFSEDEALKFYYNALALQISKSWLDKWDALENNGGVYDKDIRDATLFNYDIAALNNELASLNEEHGNIRRTLDSLAEEFTQANEFNSSLENDRHQFRLAEDYFGGKSEVQFYFSEFMLRICENVFNELIEADIQKGVYLAPGALDIDVMGLGKEQAYIVLIAKNLVVLEGLVKKIKGKTGSDSSSDGEMLILTSQLQEEQQKLLDFIANDDEDGEGECKKKIKALRRRIDELKFSSSVVEIAPAEEAILSKEMVAAISSASTDTTLDLLNGVIDAWVVAIHKMLELVAAELSNRLPMDISDITRRRMIAESELSAVNDNITNVKGQIVSKRQTLLKLREKYSLDSTKAEEIIEHIKQLKEENIQQLQKQKGIREDWEKTMRAFKDRLVDEDAFKYDQEYYQKIYINACNVVGISCTDNMRNLTENGYEDFDVVIIDEVSKATPPELLIPLMKARKAILVGDHRQLPPMFKEHEGSYKELAESQEDTPEEVRDLLTVDNFRRFQKMVTSSLFKEYFEQADDSIKHSLLVQYRMHTDIMDIINRFYEQRLSCGLSEDVERMEKNHSLTIKGVDGSTFIVPDRHAYWIDSSCTPSGQPIYEVRPHNSTSNYNVLEKFIVMELLKRIADTYKDQGYGATNKKTVGVISFYQMQVNELREAFRAAKKTYDFSAIDVDINTVDRFQGKEKNIIITCLVRNNKRGKASEHVVAFERINVAFSRAQELLFIVGAKHMYENQQVQLPNMDMPGFKTAPVYKNIMESLNRKGCFKTSDKLITPQLEAEVIAEYTENGGRL